MIFLKIFLRMIMSNKDNKNKILKKLNLKKKVLRILLVEVFNRMINKRKIVEMIKIHLRKCLRN